jgi:integrase
MVSPSYEELTMPERHPSWNKGRLLGQKPPLKPKEIWSLRIRLQLADKARDLALFNLAIDSKLRGCDLVSLRVRDVYQGNVVSNRAIVMQGKTNRPVQFEITETTRASVAAWVARCDLRSSSYLFPGRGEEQHLSVRQYSRIVKGWASCIGLDQNRYGTHSLRRTKATLIYKRTKNIRAIQLLLGHTKLESTVRYLGIEVDDALEISEQTEI